MTTPAFIPFSQSFVGGREVDYVNAAIQSRQLSGDGPYTRKCQALLSAQTHAGTALMTHSATGALEMAALLADLSPGDEVVMPSFTFVSTANAFVLRGAVPVFVDIRSDTLNLDETLVEAAITPRTRAIVPVHYAGVACEMDTINSIAATHDLSVIEDAAQGLLACYKGRPLGGIGTMGALSFHATKNISCGEGGAFLTSSAEVAAKAEIIREKGTNRSRFFRGEIDKYSWVDTGSSFIPSELNAAYLLAQLEDAQQITARRIALWDRYHAAFEGAECEGLVQRPTVPPDCQHNAHIYYLLVPSASAREQFIARMKSRGIGCTFHYVPLHETPHAQSCSRSGGDLTRTVDLASRLVRLPLWPGMEDRLDFIVDEAMAALRVPS